MRHYDRFFESKLKELSKKKKILDVGGGNPFQKYMKKYELWFKDCSYETLDISDYYKPTIVGDIHNMPIKDESYDGILCLSVLEHVDNPNKAVSELYRILKKDGIGLLFLPCIYPYHARKGDGSYKDNYRFFDDGIKLLFKDFSEVKVCKCGGFLETMSFFLPFHKHIRWFSTPFLYWLDGILGTRKKSVTWGYYFYIKK